MTKHSDSEEIRETAAEAQRQRRDRAANRERLDLELQIAADPGLTPPAEFEPIRSEALVIWASGGALEDVLEQKTPLHSARHEIGLRLRFMGEIETLLWRQRQGSPRPIAVVVDITHPEARRAVESIARVGDPPIIIWMRKSTASCIALGLEIAQQFEWAVRGDIGNIKDLHSVIYRMRSGDRVSDVLEFDGVFVEPPHLVLSRARNTCRAMLGALDGASSLSDGARRQNFGRNSIANHGTLVAETLDRMFGSESLGFSYADLVRRAKDLEDWFIPWIAERSLDEMESETSARSWRARTV